MGYLIEFPLAEDGFDESIKEAGGEILAMQDNGPLREPMRY